MNIGEQIKKLRKSLKLNQTEFGKKIGVKQTTIAGYETGAKNPLDAVVSSICREFNIREEWLKYGIEPMTSETPISIDEYARQKNMTELEKSIIMEYLDLDETTRKKVMEMLKKVFKEYPHKENKQIENKNSINTIKQKSQINREPQVKPDIQQKNPIYRVAARGSKTGYFEFEMTDKMRKGFEEDLNYDDSQDEDLY